MPNNVRPYAWGAILLALLLSCFALSSPALADDDELEQDDAPALVQGGDDFDSEDSDEEVENDDQAIAADSDEPDDDDDGGKGLLYGIFAGTLALGTVAGFSKWRRRPRKAQLSADLYRSSRSTRPSTTPRPPSSGRSRSQRRSGFDDDAITEPDYPDYTDTSSGGGDFGGGD